MGRSVLQRLVLPALRVSSCCRRCPLLLLCVSGLYLIFVVSQVGHTQLQHRDREQHRERLRLQDHLDPPGAGPGGSAAPTRSSNNVVYITLRSRRLKPANIRGTIRPKLRRKVRRSPSSHNQARTAERRSGPPRNFTQQQKLWSEAGEDYRPVEVKHEAAGAQSSSIRIYSQRPPPWLSPQDVELMRFLADSRVLHVQTVSAPGGSTDLLLFQGEEVSRRQEEVNRRQEEQPGTRTCRGRCGLISSPGDSSQVFAFHLDRVLGLNRTLPTVCRRFRLIHEGQPCPVVSWDASLYPEGLAAGWSTVRLTWGEYQSSLKQRCWHRNVSPKPDSGCSSVHHYEWSKLALFDFLLQIHSRLDRSCCGFRPRREDECVELGLHAGCRDQNHLRLSNIVHRGHDPRRLVFTSNKGFFDRNEDNLDFRLLEGIKELPEAAVSVLRSRRLRERLLQSLFLDQTYWESQGGRQGIDKLIDVIESRAKVLLTYINAHGIKVTAMNV